MGLIDFSLSDIGNIITSVREAITGKKIEDPIEIAKIDLQLQQLENAIKMGQIEINKAEAQNPNWFVAGWRPAIGWVAAVSIALMYIPKAIVITGIWTYETLKLIYTTPDIAMINLPPFPDLGVSDIIGLVLSMLGIAGMRTFEKIKKVQDKH